VSVYLDASVLVALLMADLLTARADAFLRANTPILIVSDFAAANGLRALPAFGRVYLQKAECGGGYLIYCAG
jgi:hypothetical protein